MKYQLGDMILVKDIRLRLHRPPLRHHPHLHVAVARPLPRPRPRPHLPLHLLNTFGIIIAAEKHTDIFEKDSTEGDNGYIWYSQVDQKEYYFYEDEVDGEVK